MMIEMKWNDYAWYDGMDIESVFMVLGVPSRVHYRGACIGGVWI